MLLDPSAAIGPRDGLRGPVIELGTRERAHRQRARVKHDAAIVGVLGAGAGRADRHDEDSIRWVHPRTSDTRARSRRAAGRGRSCRRSCRGRRRSPRPRCDDQDARAASAPRRRAARSRCHRAPSDRGRRTRCLPVRSGCRRRTSRATDRPSARDAEPRSRVRGVAGLRMRETLVVIKLMRESSCRSTQHLACRCRSIGDHERSRAHACGRARWARNVGEF